jgi:hypothetical protein
MTMGHPRWLLDKIADDVRRTYPEPEFRYVLTRKRRKAPSGS